MIVPPHVLDGQRDPPCDEGGHEEVDLREQLREEREDPERREPRHALAQVADVAYDQPDRLHDQRHVEEHRLADGDDDPEEQPRRAAAADRHRAVSLL